MSKRLLVLTLIMAGFAAPAGVAYALMIAPPPGPVRIVQSDLVFVGKVVEIEPAEMDAKPFPGSKDTVKYKIAVVKINEIIRGVKELKSVRVGFIPPVAPKAGVPIIGGGRRGPLLEVGQEGLFMISMHSDGNFYQAPNFGYFVPTAQRDFDAEVKTARRVVTILANPKQTLESKDADDRLMAASILISQYRTQKPPFPNNQEPIDAAESKLILNAIATASWKPGKFGDPNPYQLFTQLGITAQDGWKAPQKIKSQDDLREAVQAWIKSNGDGYRIKRFVAKAEK